MNLTDPVADFLTRIRNSIRARHRSLTCPPPSSRARSPHPEGGGYIANYKPAEEGGMKVLRVYLKYGPTTRPSSATCSASRVRMPRVSWPRRDPPRAGRTRHLDPDQPKGVMTGRQARREGVGGEILCEVW